MSFASRILSWWWGLPPAESTDVVVERDLRIVMPDGVVLLADRHYARGNERAPVVLVRSPYGRRSFLPLLLATPFAERGFQVVLQSCRGTFGSGGAFEPFHHEREDGLATVAWIKEQPWFPGKLGMMGMSYMGIAQWAVQAEAGPELKAIVVQISASDLRLPMYAGGSFWLETALFWAYLVSVQERSIFAQLLASFRAPRLVRDAGLVLPLRDAGTAVTGGPTPFFQEWLEHGAPGDPYWVPVSYSERLAQGTAAVRLLAGFQDVFLPQTLADYARLEEAGREVFLTIGPWAHLDQRLPPVATREALAFLRAHLLGDRSGLPEQPVRVFVGGEEAWRDMPAWPPPHRPERWHLHAGRALSTAEPAASEPDRYRYDPHDPTPTVGGSTLLPPGGAMDNRAVEARADVLVYSSPPLDREVLAMGPLRAELHVAFSSPSTDFFVRLCDVKPSGASINVSDGIVRVAPDPDAPHEAGATRRVEIELWPMAHCFRRGHRIRLQVSSGAHPRHARNPGSGEPLATATRLVASDQAVYHDPDRPSAILLPVVD